MRFSVALVFLISITLTLNATVFGGDKKLSAVMPQHHAKLFQAHCYDCHDSSSEEAGVNLEEISFEVSGNIESAELWQKILNAINSGEMPPKDSDPLPDNLKLNFLEDLTEKMVEARKILSDSGGVVPLRRLNRREYSNTVKSILGVLPDVSSLPDDQVGSGFDTQGGSLFMSSNQIEQYLACARQSLRLCFGETTATDKPETGKQRRRKKAKSAKNRAALDPPKRVFRRVEPEDEYNVRIKDFLDELNERAARAKAYFEDKDNSPKDFGFLDDYQAKNGLRAKQRTPQLERYRSLPETRSGASLIVTIKNIGMMRVKLPTIPAGHPGRYTVRVRAAMYPDADERFHYLEFSSMADRSRKHLGWRKVTAPLDNPEIIEFTIDHQPGKQLNLEVHQRTHQDRGEKNLLTKARNETGIGLPPGIWIDWVELCDYVPATESVEAQARILGEQQADASDDEYATEVIRRFATRLFRGRQPTESYLERLLLQFQSRRSAGESVKQALIEPLAILMASPDFLYMVEKGRTDAPDRLTGHELAVRLSYLLWSTEPDAELMKVAGILHDPAVLLQQTKRLLADAKSNAFVRDFTHQWLQMDRLGMFQFAGLDFPTFDNAVRQNAREEIFETVKLVLSEDLPIGTLLKADFVVTNDLMAGYYGLPEVTGHEFRKVPLPADSIRGGLLGTAAVAAMGSDGLRSSPVERGAWVLRHLLHDPPAPAPPNVPQLSRLEGEPIGARELTKLHQEEPQCAQCHRKIDPIGFGLENFAANGLWREKEIVRLGKRDVKNNHEFEIDASGTLPNGDTFENFREMRDLIATYEKSFARGFCEELIAYGMGRPYGFTDTPLADEIMRQADEDNYTIRSIILTFIQSETFQSR